MDSGENTRLLSVFSWARHHARSAESAARPPESAYAVGFVVASMTGSEDREKISSRNDDRFL
jgi:hypothetical protein